MNKIFFLLVMMTFTSCALFSPNPNRKKDLAPQGLILQPFTTDHCSKWPNGNPTDPKQWADCCFVHDLSYWVGGSEKERAKADDDLKECVEDVSDSINGLLMYTGVRLGGKPGDASYSWGYGWTQDREYFELHPQDAIRAKELLLEAKLNKNDKEKNIINVFIERILNKKIEN